jgi:hypothetical protein
MTYGPGALGRGTHIATVPVSSLIVDTKRSATEFPLSHLANRGREPDSPFGRLNPFHLGYASRVCNT